MLALQIVEDRRVLELTTPISPDSDVAERLLYVLEHLVHGSLHFNLALIELASVGNVGRPGLPRLSWYCPNSTCIFHTHMILESKSHCPACESERRDGPDGLADVPDGLGDGSSAGVPASPSPASCAKKKPKKTFWRNKNSRLRRTVVASVGASPAESSEESSAVPPSYQ